MLISIIIPTYNSEKYIDRCIESIIHNKSEDYEIIIVDDGSMDNTRAKLKKYKNVRYFYQENAGPSAARNLGIEKAKGKYIMFCDSDDKYEEGIIDYYKKYLLDDNYDFIIFGRKDFDNGSIINTCNYLKDIKIYDNKYLYLNNDFSKGKSAFSVVNKIYRTSIIKNNNIMFDESIKYSEDLKFNLYYLKYVNMHIVEDFSKSYIRYCNAGSLIYSKIEDFFDKNIKTIKEFEVEKTYDIAIKNIYSHYANVALHRLFYGYDKENKEDIIDEIKKIRKIFNENNLKLELNRNKSDKVLSLLFNTNQVELMYFIFVDFRKLIKEEKNEKNHRKH